MCSKILGSTIGIKNCHSRWQFEQILQRLLCLVSIEKAAAVFYIPALLHISGIREFSWWKYNHRHTKLETTQGLLPTKLQEYEFEDLLYLWSKSIWMNEKHTERAIYLVRTFFNTKHVWILFEEKYFPHPIIEWFVHKSQALIVKFRQQRKSAKYIYNFVEQGVFIQFKDQRKPCSPLNIELKSHLTLQNMEFLCF